MILYGWKITDLMQFAENISDVDIADVLEGTFLTPEVAFEYGTQLGNYIDFEDAEDTTFEYGDTYCTYCVYDEDEEKVVWISKYEE